MQVQNNDLIVSVLRKEYPEIVKSIEEIISLNKPNQTLEDLDKINVIIDEFIKNSIYEGPIDWSKSTDFIWCHILNSNEYKLCKVTEIRELLIAVIIMFYDPERILMMSHKNKKTKYGVVNQITNVLKCYKRDVSNSLSNAITYYKSYSAFRDEVNHIYESIKESSHIFQP